MQQATVNLLADMHTQPDNLQSDLVPATASTDTIAPSSHISSPLDGTSVAAGQKTTITGTATDGGGETGGQVAGVEVSVDGGSTWHPAQGRGSWSYSWTPGAAGSATIKTRAVDDSGNLESPSAGTTVNVAPRTCPCSIWDDSTTAADSNDSQAVEVGVKFRSDVTGFITGLRFYKTSAQHRHPRRPPVDGGRHPARRGDVQRRDRLRLAGGRLRRPGADRRRHDLRRLLSRAERPLRGDNGYFAIGGFDSAPLHALGDGVDGPNGVYKYGPSAALLRRRPRHVPVEQLLGRRRLRHGRRPGHDAADDQRPLTGQRRQWRRHGANVTATFSEAMDASSIDGTTVRAARPANAVVAGDGQLQRGTAAGDARPDSPLPELDRPTRRRSRAAPAASGRRRQSRWPPTSTWSFTTAAPPPPPPDEGPGGPILVIASAGNPFSRYYAEILRAEGLNEFAVDRPLARHAGDARRLRRRRSSARCR